MKHFNCKKNQIVKQIQIVNKILRQNNHFVKNLSNCKQNIQIENSHCWHILHRQVLISLPLKLACSRAPDNRVGPIQLIWWLLCLRLPPMVNSRFKQIRFCDLWPFRVMQAAGDGSLQCKCDACSHVISVFPPARCIWHPRLYGQRSGGTERVGRVSPRDHLKLWRSPTAILHDNNTQGGGNGRL